MALAVEDVDLNTCGRLAEVKYSSFHAVKIKITAHWYERRLTLYDDSRTCGLYADDPLFNVHSPEFKEISEATRGAPARDILGAVMEYMQAKTKEEE